MDFPLQYATTRRFSLGSPRDISVHPTGRSVAYLRSKSDSDPVLCLWTIDCATGIERLLVDPATLGENLDELPPAERARRERARESASGIVAYSQDSSGNLIAFAVAGQLYLVTLETGAVTSLDVGEGVFDPRLDPTGTAIAYVAGNELRLIEIDQPGSDRSIANDPDPLVSWGRAEFIAAEEMGRSRGYWWSPEGDRLLVTRVDQNEVDAWWIGDPAHPDQEPQEIRYPAAGTTNASVELWIADRGQTLAQVDWNDHGRFEYLADVLWTADRSPLVVRQTRDQRLVSIAELDIASGRLDQRHVIENDVWVELMPGSPTWSSQGLLTIEDLADQRALCLNGTPLDTRGHHVRSIISVAPGDQTEQPETALVTVWTDPTEVHVARVALAGGAFELLTTEPGVHGATTGGEHTMVVATSVPGEPHTTLTIEPGGHTIPGLAAEPMVVAQPVFSGEGDELRSAVFFPTDHDGVTPLPVLLDPYGGPHAQRVLKAHNSHLVSQWFADQGFAVIVTDGRGTPGRGPTFERDVWGDLAQPVLDDQITALDRIAEQTGLLDLDRVGIRGWSFGGYLAALAVLRRPDRVHAAIAGAPVTTWRLYDTHYTERYLGDPATHREHYDRTDLLLEADKLERPLLLIHGLADDNVVAAHTLEFSTALLAAGRIHSVLPLSGVTHMTPQETIARNLLLVQIAFLEDALSRHAPSDVTT